MKTSKTGVLSRCLPAVLLVLFSVIAPASGLSGETKRVAYIEAGPFWNFTHSLSAIRTGLEKNKEYSVVFPDELHISAEWDSASARLDREAAALQARDDVDLIIAAGTSAVRAVLRTNTGTIPIVGIDVSDPLSSGVLKTPDDSGVDNFTCDIAVDRWKRMLELFHEAIGFTRLGMLYPSGPDGKLSMALTDAREASGDAGFAILSREIPGESVDDCAAGLQWLYENGADAFFIGPLNCFDWEQSDPTPLYRLLNEIYKMPTFARDGSVQVQAGALMGFSAWEYDQIGKTRTEKILAIFNGALPRSLPMRINATPRTSVNIRTALQLGIDLPFAALIVADEIYTETVKPVLRKQNQ